MKIGMVAANLTGGEAEELRKATGGKRSEAILEGMTERLHQGMTANGIAPDVQTEIMRILSTVKEFMFPESHARSFAAIAYSSAYTRFHYRAAYTCALLNNQPMGFYSPATILNDAKRHGLKGLPIDVQHSEWFCTLEELKESDRDKYTGPFSVRVGFKYVRRLRKESRCIQLDGRETSPSYGPLACGTRRAECRAALREHSRRTRTGNLYAATAHDNRRAVGRRLRWYRANDGAAPHGISPRGHEQLCCHPGCRSAVDAERHLYVHRLSCDRPPAPRLINGT
jgi:hypothetical protein